MYILTFSFAAVSPGMYEVYADEYSSYVGKLNVSAYSDNLKTFYGEKPVAGRTVSAKLSMFDMGENIKIGDKVYRVESTLAENASENIMVYCDSKDAAIKYGLKTEKVYRKSPSERTAAKKDSTSNSKKSSQETKKTAQKSKSGSEKETSGSKSVSTHISGKSLGKFQITAYCNCPICSGQFAGKATSSGVMPKEGRTIAVDPSVISIGSKVVIDGVTYTAEDTGSGIYGNRIDIYFTDHAQAQSYGLKTKEVFAAQ
ncbi:hypothetical protein HMPREF9333_00771 [Johnsonella ignava ATCC 51276]|uniref:3D domain-containing protein n=2 Tax=Johnsonella TaxID=43994 RepID=G5GGT1_9FIRM|nr:hypothetical protein HMPREF9333_00771 [Johnsonella ignava ATCC 51276]